MYAESRVCDRDRDEAFELLLLIDKYDPEHRYASEDDIRALDLMMIYWALGEYPEYGSDDYDAICDADKIVGAGIFAFGEDFVKKVTQSR